MTRINTKAQIAFYFTLVSRLRTAEPQEAEEILDEISHMRDNSPCAAIRLRCAHKILKHRGFRVRVANGALAAAIASAVGFIVEAAALDGVVSCLDRLA